MREKRDEKGEDKGQFTIRQGMKTGRTAIIQSRYSLQSALITITRNENCQKKFREIFKSERSKRVTQL